LGLTLILIIIKRRFFEGSINDIRHMNPVVSNTKTTKKTSKTTVRQGRTLAGRSFWGRIHMTEVINRPLNFGPFCTFYFSTIPSETSHVFRSLLLGSIVRCHGARAQRARSARFRRLPCSKSRNREGLAPRGTCAQRDLRPEGLAPRGTCAVFGAKHSFTL